MNTWPVDRVRGTSIWSGPPSLDSSQPAFRVSLEGDVGKGVITNRSPFRLGPIGKQAGQLCNFDACPVIWSINAARLFSLERVASWLDGLFYVARGCCRVLDFRNSELSKFDYDHYLMSLRNVSFGKTSHVRRCFID